MKFTMEVDMSPEEARKVMGLPDVETMQKELMAKMQEKMNTYVDEMSDPEIFMKRIMPMGMGIQGMDQVQQFFSRFANAAADKKENKTEGKKNT